ncbi:hypothetical protein FS749_014420 [Ceratobasidium sp. UAMH 11750]|nr:hypothetical protein FS749_014420 [Ceratobasidium sp. UAMH 11750]
MPLFIAPRSDTPTAFTLTAGPGLVAHEYFGNGDKQHPTCCGVGVMDAGASATFKYPCYEYSIVLDGEGELVDSSKGETRTIKPGDVVYVEEGTTVTCKAKTKLKSFYVAAKEVGSPDTGML